MAGKTIPIDVVDDGGSVLYASERKIYPREISGKLARLRIAAVFWLLGMYYVFPWLKWDGRQAVLFDLPARKFHVFALTFWPQDFLFLSMLLLIAALALFFFTTLAGRLWCGYACPQTVWTEVFLWIERWTEGDRNKRMKLDAAPWSGNKLLRKGSKHALWLVLALWTGFTFVGFFTPIADLGERAFTVQWGGWETFWVLFYSLATWGNAGFLREQVCKYMCPYARFQSAMFDRDTALIAYDPRRGEPRGPRKRGMADVLARGRGLLDLVLANTYVFSASQRVTAAQPQQLGTITLAAAGEKAAELPAFMSEELGDCIDCTMCVQVCPTGIDIRNGLQYECIACGACIDACDSVMDKMGYARGLIRYSTQNAIEGQTTRVLRPRIVIYGALLLVLIAAWAWGITHRSTLIVDVLRDRNALYRVVEGGGSENGYTLKLVNKSDAPQRFHVTLDAANSSITLINPQQILEVPAASVGEFAITVRAPSSVVGRQVLKIQIEALDGSVQKRVDSSYFGPL